MEKSDFWTPLMVVGFWLIAVSWIAFHPITVEVAGRQVYVMAVVMVLGMALVLAGVVFAVLAAFASRLEAKAPPSADAEKSNSSPETK